MELRLLLVLEPELERAEREHDLVELLLSVRNERAFPARRGTANSPYESRGRL